MFLSLSLHWCDGNVRAVFPTLTESDKSINESEESVVLADTDILARVVNRTTLTNENVTSLGKLTTK